MPDLHPFTFDRIIRAVERVRERLLKSTAAIDSASIPYAATGGNAVAYWVASVDPAGVRNTPDVDLLVQRSDRERVRSALESAGFIHRNVDGAELFLENPEDANRHATRLFFASEYLRPDDPFPLPKVSESEPTPDFQVLSLEALARMELIIFKRVNRVHLRDLIDINLIDATWPSRFPSPLAERLQELLDDPDG